MKGRILGRLGLSRQPLRVLRVLATDGLLPMQPPPPVLLQAAEQPHVIDVAELMRGLEDDDDDVGDKENARPSSPPPSPLPKSPRLQRRAPPEKKKTEEEEKPAAAAEDEEEEPPPPLPPAEVEEECRRKGSPLALRKCPPGGERAAVLYTTSLGGVRKTFEDCNSVRLLLETLRVRFYERDVSMHLAYREELRWALGGSVVPALPRLFICGRDLGGADEVQVLHDRGQLLPLVEGLPPSASAGGVPCGGCGGFRFSVCPRCGGSRREAAAAVVGDGGRGGAGRCTGCNENGLVVCGLCS